MKITFWPKMILQRLPSWLALILLGLFAYLPILSKPGVVNTGDSAFLLMRLHQLVLNLRSGVFPARWMPDAAYGLGYPFFNFYASLPYYVAGLFNLLGFGTIWSLKLTQMLGFVSATVFSYLLAKNLWKSKAVALLTALAYTYTPFHLIQVYVRGDALSEFYAFALYPLILLALWRLRQKPSLINIAFLALAYAGLILSHNISALVFSPFVGLWLITYGLSSSNNKGTAISYMLYAISGIVLGLALSAWFWLPALWEGKWVHLERMTSGYLNYSGHFRGADLVQWKAVFDYRREASPYAMGAVQAIFGLAGVVSIIIWWARHRRLERNSAFLLLMLAIVTFLITPMSRPVWDTVPLLPFVQFPWRLLAVQALPLSLIIGRLARWPSKRVWRGIIAGALGLALLAMAMLDLPVEYLIIDEVNSEQVALYEYFTAYVGSTSRNEYQPRWVEPSPFTSAVLLNDGQKPPPLALQGEVSQAKLLAQGPVEERWSVEIVSPQASLAFHTYYFPGWQGYVDGQPVETNPVEGLGYIDLAVPQGPHQVVLRLERTTLRALAEGLSLAAALILIGLFIAGQKSTRQRVNEAASQQRPSLINSSLVNSLTHNRRLWAVALALFLILLPRLLPKTVQEGAISDLTLGFKRVPYPHHNPQGVPFQNGVRLRGYQLSGEEVEVGEAITVTLHWEEAAMEQDSAEAIVRLVLPATHLFQVPYFIAEDIAPLKATTVHRLEIPAESVRGIYFVSVGLRDVEGEIAALSEGGEPLDILCLSPVRLQSRGAEERRSGGAEEQGGIVLVEGEAEQESPQLLRADLVWQAGKQIPANYGTSLRLKDAEGYTVTSLDAQPLYGFYPTSLWRPGERVYDRRWLPLPEGTPPGSDYSLEAIVYDVRTLHPLVTAQVENVALTQPTVKTEYPVRYRFPQGLAITDASVERTRLEQGEVLPLTVKWAAAAPVEQDYTCLLKLKDERGEITQEWQEPIASSYPTSRWPMNGLVLAHYRLPLGQNLPAGGYHLVLALTGEELGEFEVGVIKVTAPERRFTVPEMQRELGVTFGGEVLLLGYDLAREGEELCLELHWQALRQMEMDYKVFVHLFDPATETIVTQHDAMPREGRFPTSRWAEGEVVNDSITLDLAEVPTGRYRLAVGVYDPETVDRLPAIDAAGNPVRDNRVVLVEEIEIRDE